MASSLAELLAEEGFSRGKSGMKARASFRAEAGSRARVRDQRRTDSPLGPPGRSIKNERSRSDVSRYILKGELPRSDSGSSRTLRDDLVRRMKIDSRSKTETWQKPGRRGSDDTQEDEALSDDSMEGLKGNEIVEVGAEKDERFKDIYSDKAYNSERSERSSKGNGEMNKRYGANLDKDLLKYTLLSNNNRKSLKKPQTSYESSVRGSKNAKNVNDVHRPKLQNSSPAASELALDEVAVKAVISILNGYIKRFLIDEEFRRKLHHDSLSLLGFDETAEDDSIDSKVITNLEQAIDIVEKAVEEAVSAKDLKKASLQLSVITGLKSNDLKDGYTSGIPNCRLSACAHLYLSVIYKLQKKDRISAKHLLQAFCDAPFWARTLLLPELWDYLFFPQLSHLKVWCDQEADSLPNTTRKIRKLKLLEKVYNEILDSGTYQFAFYYKDWLTEGVEAPSVPSIHIPSLLVRGVQQWGSQDNSSGQGSPSGPFSPQPMVSKKLYDAVIGISSKPGVYEVEDVMRTDEFDNGANSSYSSAADVEQEQTLTDSSELVKYLVEDMHNNASISREDNILTSPHDNELLLPSKEDWKLVKVSSSPDRDLKEVSAYHIQQDFADSETLSASSHTKDNELTLKSLAKSAFQLHKTTDPVDLKVFSGKPFKTRTSCEDFDEESLFTSAPQDFICPLTGELFDDPVTLETGQTFERESIREWFNKGNRTCPVTGKSLECISVPITNYILKRLINSWKSQYCSQLIAFASQMVQDSRANDSRKSDGTTLRVLEMIFTSFRGEERLTYAKQVIALGGLEFLIRMFKFGNFEEKTRIVPLLSTSIEVEAGCRSHIARRIDKHGLLELIRSKQNNSRRNAIFLLIELVCLSRRNDVTLFLSGLQKEEIVNVMHILLVYLQTSPLEQRPLVSVLLLKLDLSIAPLNYSIYREVAVDSISEALECSLTDEKVRENSCRALLIMGGRFSSSGKLLTERWILKQAGLTYDCEVNSQEDDLLFQSSEEDEANEERLRSLSVSLVGSGKRSLLETISKCLSSGNLELVRVCLTTVAWLSCALSSPPDADTEFQLSAFSVLIPGLKDSLENGERIELKVLASISLINFSKVPECRVLLKAIAEEIAVPLRSLAEVTWTAKQLYSTLFGE